MASSTTANLDRLAELLEAGTLRVPVQRTYPLEQAGTALEDLTTAAYAGQARDRDRLTRAAEPSEGSAAG